MRSKLSKNPDVLINGKLYKWPKRPTVVVCIDGGDPEYLNQYKGRGVIPNIEKLMSQGFSTVANGTMPSFTCPNNMSIITGTPASQHGISGNYYLDTNNWQPVVMTGPELLRGDTVLAKFAEAGASVVSITAKDKLNRQLSKGLTPGPRQIFFSSEFASQCSLEINGIENVIEMVGRDQPNIYSMELSLFVLEAGIKILKEKKPDIMYLSLTDWVQHKYAPTADQALNFYKQLDEYFGFFMDAGALLVLTADHGMSDKSNQLGEPNVIWLQDHLDGVLGEGKVQVICPITDAYIGHHGALGGFVRVWIRGNVTDLEVVESIQHLDGIEACYNKERACQLFDLPIDREADVVVVASKNYCIGSSKDLHDLDGLTGHRLRTHGGLSESLVPLIMGQKLNSEYALRSASKNIKSYEIFDYALNGTVD